MRTQDKRCATCVRWATLQCPKSLSDERTREVIPSGPNQYCEFWEADMGKARCGDCCYWDMGTVDNEGGSTCEFPWVEIQPNRGQNESCHKFVPAKVTSAGGE